jgi:penicillin-binding protein 1A
MTQTSTSPLRSLLFRWALYAMGAGALAAVVMVAVIYPTLPSVDSLKNVELQVPLRIYSADDRLITEVGEQRRLPISLDDMPERLKLAFLAAEDDRFYRHPGVDWRGTFRAVWLYAISLGQGRVPGGSTITQQVARRFFLSTEYSITRKLREILLAWKIEQVLTKDEILELYLNKEFLGHRSYGVGAAAQVYYGKTVDELTLAEIAQIAALPKAPSRDNPITNPTGALVRRDWVLGRMARLGYVSQAEAEAAQQQPNNARYHGPEIELSAPWVAEMARLEIVEQMGADRAYTGGFIARTTVDSRMQQAARDAIERGLNNYDRRHGWRGPEDQLDMAPLTVIGQDADGFNLETLDEAAALTALDDYDVIGDLIPAVVVEADADGAQIYTQGGQWVTLGLADVSWARTRLALDALGRRPDRVDGVINRGDVVRVRLDDDGQWQLAQIPQAQAALVSMDADTGAVRALMGGLDFGQNQFNRVTQSQRQPGSAFKPFVYAAALDNGYHLASLVNDAPVVVEDPSTQQTWRPQNFSERFYGPTPLREAMVESRNLISIRLLMGMGLETTRDYVAGLGIPKSDLPNGPSMALGSGTLTPMAVNTTHAAFINGGHKPKPRILETVETDQGEVVLEPVMTRVCPTCPDTRQTGVIGDWIDPEFVGPVVPNPAPEIMSPQTAWLIHSVMKDVVREGTGRRALAIGRDDLAGKTGTSNDFRDTWFVGSGGGLVTTVWVGRDDYESLGRLEQGGRTALPFWVDYMDQALQGIPEQDVAMPVGIASAWIDPNTGLRVRPGTANAVQEWFHADALPPMQADADARDGDNPYKIF